MKSTFTDMLYERVKPVWIQSYHHLFVKEIESGDLPISTFRYYLLQDRYYLANFGKLHAAIAQQLEDPEDKQFLKDGAASLQDGEISVRKQFFQDLHISKQEVEATPIAPTAYHYVTHMYYELNQGSPQRAIAGLLPCYWLYNEIGKQLIQHGSPVKLYAQWIQTYASDSYTDAVTHMIALTNRAAQQVNADEREKMAIAFLRSSNYELAFWQMAYTQEHWN